MSPFQRIRTGLDYIKHHPNPKTVAFLSPWVSSLFLLIAFLLLFRVNLSVPVTKTVSLFHISAAFKGSQVVIAESASAALDFGVWGVCFDGFDFNVKLQDPIPGIFRRGIIPNHIGASCHRGYTLDSTVASLLGLDKLVDLVSAPLTGALALYTVAAVLTFISLLSSLICFRRTSSCLSMCFSFLVISVEVLAAIMTTVLFGINYVIVHYVTDNISKLVDITINVGGIELDVALNINGGNAASLTVAAAMFLWVAIAHQIILTRHMLRNRLRTQESTVSTEKLGANQVYLGAIPAYSGFHPYP
ncbi:hypothetical protein DFH06DRAFT_1342313 [Mycena polygramma]|nr:hypothetical protein DFH06DRAFT_1342313 [Mycena polygramma]